MFKVVEVKARHAQRAGSNGNYQPEVTRGLPVYTVVHEATGLEFSYAYIYHSMAEHVAEKFSGERPSIEANFGKHYIIVSDRRP